MVRKNERIADDQNYRRVQPKNRTRRRAIKVIRVADYITAYVEQVGESGRSIMLNEYQVDGKTYWAGYSSSSETVFVSKASRD